MFENLTGKLVTTIATAIVSAACGYALKQGLIDQSQLEPAVGSIVFLIGVAFAAIERKSSHDASATKIATAEATTAAVISQLPPGAVVVAPLPDVQPLKG